MDGLGSSVSHKQRPLLGACRNGHREVVRVLLDYGADTCQPALETAVRYGQFAVVSLLLEHDAETGGALAEAVAKGYRSIVGALLERGANVKDELQGLLTRAIEIEDEVIFRTLTEYAGDALNEATRAACIKAAREKGLESIAKLV